MKSCPECYSEYEDTLKTCPADDALLKTIEKDPLVGTTLANRYIIESVIGRGGMGVVYKARSQVMDKHMAIKMLHSHLVSDAEALMRFRREAKTVAAVKHHHIITLFDFGMSAQRQPYLVMEFLEGRSLKSAIKDNGPLPLERVAHIYQQVIEALDTAHAVDLVHRDLKPENIMLSHYANDDDWVTIVDFGLSKLVEKTKTSQEDSYQITKIGDVCGSPPYMSPEQCLSSQVVDPRSDIYSVAICIYETLSGKLPFNAKSAIEMLDAHLYATPIPFNQTLAELKVCTELTNVLNKALQKEPEKRHQTIAEFGTEFSEAVRRDALKLKTYRHRLQTSEFSDLASEAEALSRQMGLGDNGLQMLVPANTSLDGIQFVNDQAKSHSSELRARKKKPTDRSHLDTNVGIFGMIGRAIGIKPGNSKNNNNGYGWTHCPYCDAPAEPGIRFCLNCKHQFISPQEAAKLRAAQEMDASSEMSGTRGFSKRAKGATSGGGGGLATMQRVLGVVFLMALAYLVWYGYSNGTLDALAHRMVPALKTVNHDSPDTETTAETPTPTPPAHTPPAHGSKEHHRTANGGRARSVNY